MTTLLYLNDMSIREAAAKVVHYDSAANVVILDQSPFYPQGGGQPSDKGTLKFRDFEASVSAVKKDPQGRVLHYLTAVEGGFGCEPGQEVHCTVDGTTRDLNSRAHSGGHLLDHAIEDLKLPLEVGGAFHFLPSPYVEYFVADDSIQLTPEFIADLQAKLEIAANAIVKEALPVTVYEGKVTDLPAWRQNLLPESVRLGGSVRLIRFEREGFEPVPCSGTHVTNSALIKPIKIKKIKVIQEKRSIRVTYLLT